MSANLSEWKISRLKIGLILNKVVLSALEFRSKMELDFLKLALGHVENKL